VICLVHHGAAVPASVDAQRPAADAGRAAVERLARQAAGRGVAQVEIRHSLPYAVVSGAFASQGSSRFA